MGHEPELLSSSIGDNVTLGDRLDPDTYLRMTSMDKDLKEWKHLRFVLSLIYMPPLWDSYAQADSISPPMNMR